MKAPLEYVVVADGPSDRALLPVVRWALRDLRADWEVAAPTFRVRGSTPIATILEEVRDGYAPDLIFLHRDAEKEPYAERLVEIPAADDVVPVIPVRMTEAWLLIDEAAIRTAAGNPNGRDPIALPRLPRLESLPDPKKTLRELLVEASGLGARRRQRFDHSNGTARVAELIEDFSPLKKLEAFALFFEALTAALERVERDAEHGSA